MIRQKTVTNTVYVADNGRDYKTRQEAAFSNAENMLDRMLSNDCSIDYDEFLGKAKQVIAVLQRYVSESAEPAAAVEGETE